MNKKELVEHLRSGIVTVTFKKVSDDSIRRMKCSLSKDYIGEQQFNNTNKQKNEDIVPVWDVDKNGWRSFRIDRVVKVDVTDENN